MNNWIKKWWIGVLSCLVIITGCGVGIFLYYFIDEKEVDALPVINQVRLQLNEIMLMLREQHMAITKDADLQSILREMCQEHQVSVIYAGLDGRVLFSSKDEESPQEIHLNTDLHYDLYQARVNENTYNIAFPVVDNTSQLQVGNAIFTVPKGILNIERSSLLPIALVVIMILMIGMVGLLALLMRRKVNRDVIAPIYQLKDHSEGILKGNYDQLLTPPNVEEISEVYAMFDQMRMEIMDHSQRRDEQDQAQKELISSISHEIKTPLTTLKAYIEAIREGVCEDMTSVMEYMEVMHTNTEKMTRLTEDLLLHALKELGHISVTLTEQYSRDVLEPILLPIGHYVRTTGVHFHEPKHIPNVLIHVDAHRLEQVISNLISNALKHTDTDDVISVHIELQEKDLQITIADTGRGILPADMPFVFDRYFKGNLNTAPKKQGTGLGLSICKHIIEAHHGSISFQSVQGQGTVFTCNIPL